MPRKTRVRVEKSAGGVVLRTILGVPHALLIRDPYKKWGLPKGRVEKGETLAEAAVREVREEAGLADVRLGPELVTIDWLFHVDGRPIHKFTTFFLMYSDDGEAVPARPEGITRCEWVPLRTAHEKISYENASEVMKVAQSMALMDTGSSEAAD